MWLISSHLDELTQIYLPVQGAFLAVAYLSISDKYIICSYIMVINICAFRKDFHTRNFDIIIISYVNMIKQLDAFILHFNWTEFEGKSPFIYLRD